MFGLLTKRQAGELSKNRILYFQAWFFTLVCLVVLFPVNAEAAQTFGSIICNIKKTSSGYVRILNAVAFIVGLLAFIRGILFFKKHSDNPNDSQVTKAVAHLIGGALLMAMTAAVFYVQNTVLGVSGRKSGNFESCNGSGGSSQAMGLDEMMSNLVNDIHGPMFVLLSALSVIIGLTYIYRGLVRGAKTGADPRAANPKDIANHLVIGAILVSMGSMLPSILTSMFGIEDVSSMKNFSGIQWSNFATTGTSLQRADVAVKAVLAFIQVIGGISFLRGWLIIKAAVEGGGQATIPQGATHIIGGAMAINIDVMLRVFDATFGTNLIKG